ncbi:MAG: glycosyltransferase family 2 protein [Cyanobacteria bacterium]|nr:glycosyltransferase family 2 protein [Cyanobacteriota bacterium]
MIFVALPAYNESEALPRLLQRMRDTQPLLPEPLSVIVVDDGSTDGTAAAARQYDSAAMRVEVVVHERNRGLHGALDTGFRAAVERAGADDWVLTMDADDTHSPDQIGTMLAKAKAAGANVVIASRFQPGAEWFGLSWDRVLFSKTVSWMFRIAWPMRNVRDYTCGYRLYRADLLKQAYRKWGDGFVNEPSFACMPDVLWKVSRLSPVFAEVPLSLHYERKPGESKMNVARTIRRTLGLIVKRRFGINT